MMNAKPSLDEIRQAHDAKKSGVLTLARDNDTISLFYREGRIEAASSNLGSYRLGQFLIKEEYVDPKVVETLISKAQRQKVCLGEAAVRNRFIDPSDLADVVRNQVMELVKHALENDFSPSGFVSGIHSIYAPAKIEFSQIILELSRTNVTRLQIPTNSFVVLRTDQDLSRFAWHPQELFVLSCLKIPASIPDLARETEIATEDLEKILTVFDRLGLLEVLSQPDLDPRGGAEADNGLNTAVIKRPHFPLEYLIPRTTNALVSEKLEVLNNGSSFISEQFKNLKVRINEMGLVKPLKAITISSPAAQDGKSLIAANLGMAFSIDAGKRVIAVDCDLRNPSLHRYLGVPLEPGIGDYLGNGHLGPQCYIRRMKNLFFLTAGTATADPIELLSMDKMKDLIECLKIDFDTILIDAPPLAAISDARIVTGLSDALVLVVRRGKTPYGSIENTLRTVNREKLLGVVFNDVQPMLFHTHYSYGYAYYDRYEPPKNRKIRTRVKTYLDS